MLGAFSHPTLYIIIVSSSFYDADSKCTAKGPVIGDNLLLGCGASIVGDITVGDNVKVSLNSMVDKDFPSDAVLIGVPARNVVKSEAENS